MSSELATKQDWCHIVLPLMQEAPVPMRARARGSVSLKDVLLDPDKQLPSGTIIKVWYALLQFADAVHGIGQQVIRAHLGAWIVKPPNRSDTNAQTRSIGLTHLADKGTNTIDELSGEVWLAAEADLALFSAGVPLPDNLGIDRYAAPEARAGTVVSPAADVYLAARVTLDLLTGRPVAVTHEDVTDILAVLRLFRADLPTAVLMTLERCLSKDPAERPPTPNVAAEKLAQAVAEELAACKAPWKRFALNPDRTGPYFGAYRRIALGLRKQEEAAGTFLDVTAAHDDDLLFEPLDEDFIVAAVFDGVSKTDIGSGAIAAASAKNGLMDYLTDAVKRSHQNGAYPESTWSASDRFAWLKKLAIDGLRKAHVKITKYVRKEFARELRSGRITPQTTATVALIQGDFAVVAWVGDSPAFLVGPEGAVRLTAAQTAGSLSLVKAGLESARTLENPAALSASLGSLSLATNEIAVKVTPLRLREDVLLVLGTDGVLAFVGDDEQGCVRFLEESGREALKSKHAPVDRTRKLFMALWDESSRRESHDDRTLVVFAADFVASDE